MIGYLVRRLLSALLLFVALTFASFWVMGAHLNPLYPLFFYQPRPTEKIDALTRLNHLDDPIVVRYWLWVKGLFTGADGHHTVLAGTPIWHPVLGALLRTLELAAGSLVVALVFGLGIGVLAASRWGGLLDRLLRVGGYLAWSIPVFISALVLQAAVQRVDRTTGFSPFAATGAASGSGLGYVASWFGHMTVPIVSVALGYIGLYSRYVRSAMLVTIHAPYTTVARGKGLGELRVLLHHALRNALVPITAVVTLDLAALVSTTLVADVVFGLQGLGSIFLGSIRADDPFQIEAIVVTMVGAVIVLGFLGDLVVGWLDPRIREG